MHVACWGRESVRASQHSFRLRRKSLDELLVRRRGVTFSGDGDGGSALARSRSGRTALEDMRQVASVSFSGIGGVLSPESLLDWPEKVPSHAGPGSKGPRRSRQTHEEALRLSSSWHAGGHARAGRVVSGALRGRPCGLFASEILNFVRAGRHSPQLPCTRTHQRRRAPDANVVQS